MSVADTLVLGIDNFVACTGCIKCTFWILLIGMILQIVGFKGNKWSVSTTSQHGLHYLCHRPTDMDVSVLCCDLFDTGWLTAAYVCQVVGLVSSSATFISVLLFTCSSRTRGQKYTRRIFQNLALFTGSIIGSSAAIYAGYYWKNHILQDHHLGTSFTIVVLACLSFLTVWLIIIVNGCTGYFEEAPPSCPTAQTPLLSSASQRDRTTSNTSTRGQIPTCAICSENQRDVIFNCGHLVCCNTCATTLQNSDSYICPSCRRPITSQRRVYI
ncbi:unnamed protein product [Mytilus edulis]|uniref:RING-type domain-containing protein n=1 Tax=Mytilus edulis TaxID=6550 RepID=A0A8S3SRX5_MYTED|nr:unnamed protein product [Mytilus edulis]